jgi:L-ascorbate metabolism protein UlaG (beta-lactamase superfamily)
VEGKSHVKPFALAGACSASFAKPRTHNRHRSVPDRQSGSRLRCRRFEARLHPKRTNATVISNYEISGWLEKQGLTNVHGQQHGGSHAFPFGKVKLTLAFHGSALPDGSYGGNPCGFLLYLKDGTKIYDAADTGLFGDMRLIGEEGINLAIVPIGDNFTMGPDDAVRAIKLLQPRKVVPIHYNTWPLIAQDANAWAARIREQTKATPVILKPGDWLEL